jgi:hypothetical protein
VSSANGQFQCTDCDSSVPYLLRFRCYPVPHLHWRPHCCPQRSLYLSSQPVREQRQRPIPMYNCDASCATCSGSAATQCLTCTGGLTPLSGACTCLPNQFVSSANGQFQCTTAMPMCHLLRLRCYPVPHLHWRSNCPQRSLYLSSQPVREQRQRQLPMYNCDASCATCSGSAATQCLTCTGGLTAPQRSLYLSSQPVREQRQRQLPMYNCDASCATCSGSAATQCLTCTGGLTPLSGACTCLPNQFVSSANGQFQCTTAMPHVPLAPVPLLPSASLALEA